MKKMFLKMGIGLFYMSAPFLLIAQNSRISYFRPYDKSGVNVFETSKADSVEFKGLEVKVGGGFTQQMQSLDHSNDADSSYNQLVDLTTGFNTAMANMNIDAQLADGIHMNLVTYLSARHHSETWVKGGFIQFDKLPFQSGLFDQLMEYTTIRLGHMEINYGDAHFRRSDNGNSIYNPFVENYILDAFNTEIGGEIIVQHNGLIVLFGVTGGEIKGNVIKPAVVPADDKAKMSPSFYGKLGVDKQFSDKFRLRATGSFYSTASSVNNNIYGGDRSGSHYFFVMENQATNSQFYSGRLNPGFKDKVTSVMGNLFIKYAGVEFFGTYEFAKGRSQAETSERNVNQLAAELIFRFGKNENLFLGTRYNTVDAELAEFTDKVNINRTQLGGGWFLTDNILLKGEYVTQKYKDFPRSDIRSSGKFDGFAFEAVVGF